MSTANASNTYQPIENYAIIGNLHTAALISKEGSIDFLSFTRFESPTVFTALLDSENGGKFSLTPQHDNVKYKQLYIPQTAILITQILTGDSITEITDFMPVMHNEEDFILIRSVKCIMGNISLDLLVQPLFDYARVTPEIVMEGKNIVTFKHNARQPEMRLLSTYPLNEVDSAINARLDLKEGQTEYFVLESEQEELKSVDEIPDHVLILFDKTMSFWRHWISKSTYDGQWLEMIQRSAITLKLLTSCKFGSTVAALTFGLPERIGGPRNWDYRYTWIRDTSFTMYTFLRLGFQEEAQLFLQWLEEQCLQITDGKDLNIMYAVDGSTQIDETTLDHLQGYKGSKPVRIGNGTHKQFQLDIYGELIDTIHVFNEHGGQITYDFWGNIEILVEHVCNNWEKPDYGIWEVRYKRHELLHSRVMCWLALDRAIKIAVNRGFPSPVEKWLEVRDRIYKDIYFNFWDDELKAYVQYKGAKTLDGAALQIPLIKFLSPQEPRWLSTLKAIERELVVDCLVYRYIEDEDVEFDGIAGGEGTFSVCSFWYAECLAKSGDLEKARIVFEKMLGYANHVGLYAEELSLQGEHLGNFPQAYTHLGLISAALELNDILSGMKRKF